MDAIVPAGLEDRETRRRIRLGRRSRSGSSPAATCCSPTCPATRCGSGRRRAAWRNSSILPARRAPDPERLARSRRQRPRGLRRRTASCSRTPAIARIQRLDLATKKKTPVAMSFEGKKFSSPNDVVKMKSGVFFFTDPPYGFKKFDDAPEKEIAVQRRVPLRHGRQGHAPSRRSCTARTASRCRPMRACCTWRSPKPSKAIIMAYSLDADGNVTGKKLFHDFTDLVGDRTPRAARRPRGCGRRHDLRHRSGRRAGAVEGRQAPRPHLGRQAHRQLQVRRRRPDAVHDLARHAGAHPAQHQGRGILNAAGV